MQCAQCGAPRDRNRTYCGICGREEGGDHKPVWNRDVEAQSFVDLEKALAEDEALLGVTRGKAAGNWRGRWTMTPQALLSPYVNVGLTADRILIQPIQAGTGRALTERVSSIPLAEVCAMETTDTDLVDPGRTVRLVIQLASGDTLRVRASGRLADAAREIAGVYRSLAGPVAAPGGANEATCAQCQRQIDRNARFCPFCGHAREGI